ncbi:hypothetical protein PR048_029640 [Dryococelus australis]|uniref:Uncharacterized protein n=1 Tax=Dryococelus australis TaxID=614101 RepID=A0ABQ9GEK8_9NEOP|nr:hypothetical protein PR048_029640 [Dryococelus australis]
MRKTNGIVRLDSRLQEIVTRPRIEPPIRATMLRTSSTPSPLRAELRAPMELSAVTILFCWWKVWLGKFREFNYLLAILRSPAYTRASDVRSLAAAPERATVAKRLARLPPTKANMAQSLAGSPDFRMWESCRMMPLFGEFSQRSPVSPTLPFRRCSILTSVTLIGSQDLAALPEHVLHFPSRRLKTTCIYHCWLSKRGRGRELPAVRAPPTSPGIACGYICLHPPSRNHSPRTTASLRGADGVSDDGGGIQFYRRALCRRYKLASCDAQVAVATTSQPAGRQRHACGDPGDAAGSRTQIFRVWLGWGVGVAVVTTLPGPSGPRPPEHASAVNVEQRGKQEIPEKTRRPVASSGMIPTRENWGASSSGIEQTCWQAEKQFNVGTPRLVVRSQRDRSTSRLLKRWRFGPVCGVKVEGGGADPTAGVLQERGHDPTLSAVPVSQASVYPHLPRRNLFVFLSPEARCLPRPGIAEHWRASPDTLRPRRAALEHADKISYQVFSPEATNWVLPDPGLDRWTGLLGLGLAGRGERTIPEWCQRGETKAYLTFTSGSDVVQLQAFQECRTSSSRESFIEATESKSGSLKYAEGNHRRTQVSTSDFGNLPAFVQLPGKSHRRKV